MSLNQIVASTREVISKIEPTWTVALVPIWQEVVFRYLPFQFWYLLTRDFWLVGIVSSLAFAAMHWYFGKWFTVAAFFAGILYWLVMVKYGLIAAILLHAAVNSLDLLLGIRYKFFGRERPGSQVID